MFFVTYLSIRAISMMYGHVSFPFPNLSLDLDHEI